MYVTKACGGAGGDSWAGVCWGPPALPAVVWRWELGTHSERTNSL